MNESSKTKLKKAYAMRLKMARIDAGYTQKEFSQALGLEPGTYAKYENRSELPPLLLPIVCDLTGIDPWYFLTGKPKFIPNPRRDYTKTPQQQEPELDLAVDIKALLAAIDQFQVQTQEFSKDEVAKAKAGIKQFFDEHKSSTKTTTKVRNKR